MMIDTALGPVDASLLSVERTTQEIPAGMLATTTYRLGDQVVKIDQGLEVSEAFLEAQGTAHFPTPFN